MHSLNKLSHMNKEILATMFIILKKKKESNRNSSVGKEINYFIYIMKFMQLVKLINQNYMY